MKLDGNIGLEIKNSGSIAKELESLGYSGWMERRTLP